MTVILSGRPIVGQQRVSALRFGDRTVQALCHAVLIFDSLPVGFSNFRLRQHLASLPGLSPDQIKPGAMTCHLRRLRLHGMIERIPHTHRYRLTDFGRGAALFFTRTYDHLLRPGLGSEYLPATSVFRNQSVQPAA